MAPVLRARQSLPKDKFSSYFGGLRSQPYNDPNSSRGGSHTYGFYFGSCESVGVGICC